jgi:hypothetical protein
MVIGYDQVANGATSQPARSGPRKAGLSRSPSPLEEGAPTRPLVLMARDGAAPSPEVPAGRTGAGATILSPRSGHNARSHPANMPLVPQRPQRHQKPRAGRANARQLPPKRKRSNPAAARHHAARLENTSSFMASGADATQHRDAPVRNAKTLRRSP